jgi:cytochrome c553
VIFAFTAQAVAQMLGAPSLRCLCFCRKGGKENVPVSHLPASSARRPQGWAIGVCISFMAIVFAGCHSAPELTPQEAEGKHLYQVRCAHCHEDNDLALKKVPPDLHGVFKHKTLPSGAPATDAAVRSNILTGKGMMPSFAGRFDDEQMAALLAYLHTGLR